MKKMKDSPARGTPDAKEEKGIAIIMTLGILAILLVVALSFAASARTTMKAASANANVIAARLIAESAAARVVALMGNYDMSQLNNGIAYTHTPSADTNGGTYDWTYHLRTVGYLGSDLLAWEDNAFYTHVASASDAAETPYLNWEYIYDDPTSSDKKIIGRVAYFAWPLTGADPLSLVKSGADESTHPESRIGKEPNEINIASLAEPSGASSWFNAKVPAYNLVGTGAGTMDASARSFGVMFDSSHINVTDSARQQTIEQWFVEDPQATPEAFWIDHNDIDGDGSLGNSTGGTSDAIDSPYELYNRFNLARTDWDDLDTSDSPSSPNDVAYLLDSSSTALTQWSNSGSDNGHCIPWLAAWQSTAPGYSATERSKQIAANLIDYCDSDSIATTDDPNNPTYTGNESTPCINEARVEVEGDISETTNGSGGSDYTFTASLKGLDVEVVNPYPHSTNSNFSLQVTYSVEVEWTPGSGIATQTLTMSGTTTLSGSAPASSYKNVSKLSVDAATTTVSGASGAAKTLAFKLTSLKIRENSSGGDFWDYAFIADSSHMPAGSPISLTAGTPGCVDAEVDDPRQNLKIDDWKDNWTSGGSGIGSLGSVNTAFSPSASGDQESATEPWNVSTMYVANAPMKSLWELGAIHRGAKWETINLKEYNSVVGTGWSGGLKGGNQYSDTTGHDGGDANILDQVKLTSDTDTFDSSTGQYNYKISLSTKSEDVLYALLNRIQIGSDYNEIHAGGLSGTAITGGSVSTLAGNIKAAAPTIKTRGEIATVAELFNGSCGVAQTSDAEKEELIGKFMNLCDLLSSDFYTVVILAQSIKDIGGVTIFKDLDANGAPTSTISESTCGYDVDGKDDSSSGSGNTYYTLDDFKDDSIGSSPEQIATQYGRYDQYADEILAEQKIKVVFYKDPITGKVTVLSYEYLNE